MYNQGLAQFIQTKKLKANECINSFLKANEVTDFTAKNHNRVNGYIEKNWTKFASFVDNGIKNGTLSGQRIKLNSYYQEQKERVNIVKGEFINLELTNEQKLIINHIKVNGVSKIQSFLQKQGINPLPKDYSFTSKQLQWMPLVNQAIQNNFK